MHIDVNSAYLSWEASDMLKNGSNIDIRSIPSVIGGDQSKRHGIVLAKSIPSKKYGIVTGESIYNALRKCKELKIYPPHFDIYERESNNLYNYLLNYSPKVERASIDECYIDYTGMEQLFGDAVLLANKIKEEIKNKYGWTVNIGIGNNKLCAKMASDFSKPDKVHTLFMDEVKDKMWSLPVSDLFMIGRETVKKLNILNVKTIGDLANYNFFELEKTFKNQAHMMKDFANGIDNSEVIAIPSDNKGMSMSKTYPKDLISKDEIKEALIDLVNELCIKLRNMNVYASVISLILKNSNFVHYSCQKKIDNATNTTNDIYKECLCLLDKLYKDEPIRLVGISFTSFTKNKDVQLSLFDTNDKREVEKLEKTIDKINEKYGNKVINYAVCNKKKNK